MEAYFVTSKTVFILEPQFGKVLFVITDVDELSVAEARAAITGSSSSCGSCNGCATAVAAAVSSNGNSSSSGSSISSTNSNGGIADKVNRSSLNNSSSQDMCASISSAHGVQSIVKQQHQWQVLLRALAREKKTSTALVITLCYAVVLCKRSSECHNQCAHSSNVTAATTAATSSTTTSCTAVRVYSLLLFATAAAIAAAATAYALLKCALAAV
eukprot:2116-Heterococcus_DN1.PRE.1